MYYVVSYLLKYINNVFQTQEFLIEISSNRVTWRAIKSPVELTASTSTSVTKC